MPEIKLQNVVSFSSEDKNHPAANLLRPDGTHKWKCAKAGEKSASVILQFQKAEQILSVDIGNEASAFVEILVARSTSSVTELDFQVLLGASSFMTPTDSRNGTNRNAVRMFGPDKLSKTTLDQKWDRVKVVCTQPFNKTSTYGLSFIKFHSTPSPPSESQPPMKLGAFTLREETETQGMAVGALFAARDKARPDPSPSPATGAANIRAASKASEESYAAIVKKTNPPPPSQTNTKRHHSRDDSHSSEKKIKKTGPTESTESRVTDSAKSREIAKPTPSASRDKKQEHHASGDPPTQTPIGSLMRGVVFVMSGYQNPQRGDVRDKALEMGAAYRPDWDSSCTHLICAFANTPKYVAVEGKGKIVNKSWITDSYRQKKLMPWRKYRVGDAPSPEARPDEAEPMRHAPPAKRKSTDAGNRGNRADSSDSGGDTDDELERLNKPKTTTTPKTPKGGANFDVSTDEDAPPAGEISSADSDDSGLPWLPDFFTDKTFYLYGEFSLAERKALLRYITAYNGHVENYMTPKVNFVLTHAPWDEKFDEALNTNAGLIFVRPRWVYKCSEASQFLPFQPHVIVPQA